MFNIGSSLRLRERYEKISTAPAQRKFFDSLSCQVTTTKSNNSTAIIQIQAITDYNNKASIVIVVIGRRG